MQCSYWLKFYSVKVRFHKVTGVKKKHSKWGSVVWDMNSFSEI